MTAERPTEHLSQLVDKLRELPRETEWVELKENKADPHELGEYISALSNAAALHERKYGYLVWGIRDGDHAVVGTTFDPGAAKQGNEDLENWLQRLLEPGLAFRFFPVLVEGKSVVVLEIEPARLHPTRFSGQEFIRVGSYKKKLKDHPEKERALWRVFERTTFESGAARERTSTDEVVNLLDYTSYFDLLGRPLPESKRLIVEDLARDGLVQPDDAGMWTVTNLGALLFAKRLDDFGHLGRKGVRVIIYPGRDRLASQKEQLGGKGYASGFAGLIAYINGLVPANEVIGQALRKTVPMYPELAVRELVANALVHQDLVLTGTGPMIEIFSDRMEVSNPGTPLVATDRFVDAPPRSRNEAMASLLRRAGICEERGSGIDKVVHETEVYQLPAPLFEVAEGATRAVLFAQRELQQMDPKDRIRACYLHACLRYVSRDFLTNTSLRKRFGLDDRNTATASRLIREAVTAGAIVAADENASKKYMKYIPWWAIEAR